MNTMLFSCVKKKNVIFTAKMSYFDTKDKGKSVFVLVFVRKIIKTTNKTNDVTSDNVVT